VAVRPEHLYKAVGLLFLVLLLHTFFGPISRVFLLVYAAAIVAVAMNVLVAPFASHRRIASGLLGLAIFVAIGLGLWLAVPALASQLRGLSGELPRLEQHAADLSAWVRNQTGLNVELMGPQAREFVRDFFAGAEVIGTAWGVIEGLFLPLVIIIGAIYAVAKPNDRLLNPVLHAVPADRREDFRRLFLLLGGRIRGWVKGTLMAMIAVGVLTTLGLWIIGVEYALLLGLISGILEIIPLAGPWVAGAIAVGIAFLDDPTKALYVAILMLAIQQLESNLITPIVMSQAAEVHPFVTLFALFFFGSLFGFLGVILALPLVLLLWTVLEVLWVERAIKAGGDEIEPVVREG
jgi:predicted PurR-regulated permease PerM